MDECSHVMAFAASTDKVIVESASDNKKQKDQNALYMIGSMYSRRCGSYRMYLEGDSPHQTVMIVCELKQFSHIPNRHK